MVKLKCKLQVMPTHIFAFKKEILYAYFMLYITFLLQLLCVTGISDLRVWYEAGATIILQLLLMG